MVEYSCLQGNFRPHLACTAGTACRASGQVLGFREAAEDSTAVQQQGSQHALRSDQQAKGVLELTRRLWLLSAYKCQQTCNTQSSRKHTSKLAEKEWGLHRKDHISLTSGVDISLC